MARYPSDGSKGSPDRGRHLSPGVCGMVLWAAFLGVPSVSADTVVLVAAAASVPTSFVEEGKQSGILIDVINEVFRRAGHTVVIRLMPWARCQEEVRSGAVDGIFSIYLTPERQRFLTYTNEVLITQVQAFFVLSDSTLTFGGDLGEFSHQRIGIINQTSYGPRMDAALKTGVFTQTDLSADSESNVKKLVGGRVDLIPSYRHVVLATAKRLGFLGRIRELAPVIEAIPSYLAFSNKRDYSKLIEDFDRTLAAMKKDGTYDKIFRKYLQENN